MTPRNWWNVTMGVASSAAAIVATWLDLDWLICWAFVSAGVLFAVDLIYCVSRESAP